MRVEYVRAWLCEQLDADPESMVTVNDLWMEFLKQFDGTLKDRQMAYWKFLGCPYEHYNLMEEWWGGYMNAWPRIEELEAELKIQDNANDILTRKVEELQSELASYMESDANLRKRVDELEAENKKLKKEIKKWQTQSRRAAREAYRLKPNPKPKSVRTVQGGLPGLGKNRKN